MCSFLPMDNARRGPVVPEKWGARQCLAWQSPLSLWDAFSYLKPAKAFEMCPVLPFDIEVLAFRQRQFVRQGILLTEEGRPKGLESSWPYEGVGTHSDWSALDVSTVQPKNRCQCFLCGRPRGILGEVFVRDELLLERRHSSNASKNGILENKCIHGALVIKTKH